MLLVFYFVQVTCNTVSIFLNTVLTLSKSFLDMKHLGLVGARLFTFVYVQESTRDILKWPHECTCPAQVDSGEGLFVSMFSPQLTLSSWLFKTLRSSFLSILLYQEYCAFSAIDPKLDTVIGIGMAFNKY